MTKILEGLKPEKVFGFFEDITKIPHGSGNEKQISDYIYHMAKDKGWDVTQDEAFNIILRKPATKGYENAPTVLLQGHMDMVCEKNEGVVHDFEKDSLKLKIVDGQLFASETTLGADNGIAVAMILAIFDSNAIEHPAIEALFTVDEEMGMTGVQNMAGDMITAEYLINLDSEEEGIITAGCAGGVEIDFSIPVKRVASKSENAYMLKLSGLSGGHSGMDAHREKGYSNKLMARVLYDMKDEIELISIDGGSKPNAIPREAKAVIKTDNLDLLHEKIDKWNKILKNEYTFTDPEVNINIENIEADGQVLSNDTTRKILTCINLIQVGVMTWNTAVHLVTSSNNLGIVSTEDDFVCINCHPRSSILSLLKEKFVPSMEQLAKAIDVEINTHDYYPGWEYAKESKLRDICAKTYKDMTGSEAKVEAIHAGLECGYLLQKCPSLKDAVSIGPNMADVHTPNEHLEIKSVERTYNYLCEILKNIR